MIDKLICIVCPKGCELSVNEDNGCVTVSGNQCVRGKQYAIDETINPVRTVTFVVRVENRKDTMLSVKTDKPIRKDEIKKFIDKISSVKVKAPIKIGEEIFKYGEIKIVATNELL